MDTSNRFTETLLTSCVITQLISTAVGHIIFPTEETLYVATGNPLLLKCNISGLPGEIWHFSTEMEQPFKIINTEEGGSGFHVRNLWFEGEQSSDQKRDQVDQADNRNNRKDISYAISELRKDSMKMSDSGIYRCHSMGRLTDTIQVNVVEMITEDVALYNWTSDAEVKMTCYIVNQTLASNNTIAWYHRDSYLPHDPKKYLLNGSILTVFKVGLDDIGTYTCKSTSKSSENIYQTVQLFAPPFVRCDERSVGTSEGYSAEIICTVYGWPTAEVSWYRGEELLTNNTDPRIKVYNATEEGRTRITIDDVIMTDREMYRCSAWNVVRGENREFSSSVLLRVKSRYAALWPLLGILAEALILIIIIAWYERQQRKKKRKEAAENPTNNTIANRSAEEAQRSESSAARKRREVS